MKVLIIDNYDSFTFNLYQYVGEILKNTGEDFDLDVKRNNEISVGEIKKQKYDRIIISPGPGTVEDKYYFGVCAEVITELGKEIPVLGVCLGMQGIGYCFGGKINKAKKPMHGKTNLIKHDNKGVFEELPQDLEIMRYHSLVVEVETLPKDLEITAKTNEEKFEIMGLRHKKYPIEGVQFHPESFATEGGHKILSNFLFQKQILN